jgi:hypothetical protein
MEGDIYLIGKLLEAGGGLKGERESSGFRRDG